jgi:hypothetical protein
MIGRYELVFVALLAGCASVHTPPGSQPPEITSRAPEQSTQPVRRSPFAEPPGALSIEVTQANISTTICVPGWAATVRPSTGFTQGLKRDMLGRAGLSPKDAIKYELDHSVPLAIGGHPRSEDNPWLQHWDGQ